MNQNQINPTSLEEAQEVCGESLNSEAMIQNAEAIFYGDVSSSVARLNAWETFSAARATNFFETQIVSTPFPCGTAEFCLENVPYTLSPGLIALYDNQIGLVNSGATKSFAKIFGDPNEMLAEKRASAKARAIKNNMSEEEAAEIANQKAFQLGKNFPITLFGDNNGNTFPSISVRDNEAMVEVIGNVLFPNRKGVFVVKNPLEDLGNINLSKARELFTAFTEKPDGVAMKCTCPECSYSGKIVEHAVSYSGMIAAKYGSFSDGSVVAPKCRYMNKLVSGEVNINDYSFKQLIEAGFMPQGLCMYLLEGNANYKPNRVLAIRNYSNPRGTIKTATRLWEGQAILTPSGYIKLGNRDANAYELIEFMRAGGSELVQKFSDCIPKFSDGRKYTLDLQTGEIKIET